ncbi:MAG: tetratricopeptide repeat protein [Candidatus Sericytochromatia bacterium]
MFSTDLDTAFQQAMQAFHEGHWQEAETALTRLSERWPDCKEVWYQRAELCQRQERLNEAVDCYGRVLELDPRVQEVYLQLGRIAAAQAHPDLALGYWEQALAINPAYHDARLNLALLLAQLGEAPQSQAAFAEVLRQAPELAAELLNTAREHLQRGQALETLALCAALAEVEPSPCLHLLAAWACQLCGDEGGAQHFLATLPESWGPAIAGLYVPAQLSEAERPLWRERVQTHLQTSAVLPAEILGDLPRWPGWHDLDLQAEIDRWLCAAVSLPPRQSTAATARSVQRLIWVLDADVLPWLPWYDAQLSALPRRHWEIWLALRSPRLAPLLHLSRRCHLFQLEPELLDAQAQIQALQPDVLLLSHPQRDSLQFWLQHTPLAPVQGSWSAWQAAAELPDTPAGNWPLWPLTPVVAEAETPDSASAPVLFPVSAQGWTPGDLLRLLRLLEQGPVCLCAELTRLPQLQTLQQQLLAQNPAATPHLELRLWLDLAELDRLLLQARGLLLPERGAAPYVLAARRVGLSGLSEVPPSFDHWPSPDATPWRRWHNTLPATAWPVQLQHLLTQVHREEPHA